MERYRTSFKYYSKRSRVQAATKVRLNVVLSRCVSSLSGYNTTSAPNKVANSSIATLGSIYLRVCLAFALGMLPSRMLRIAAAS